MPKACEWVSGAFCCKSRCIENWNIGVWEVSPKTFGLTAGLTLILATIQQVGDLPYTIKAAVADDSATAFSQLRASLKLAGRCNDSARDDSARAESIASGRDSPNSRRTSLASCPGVPVIEVSYLGLLIAHKELVVAL